MATAADAATREGDHCTQYRHIGDWSVTALSRMARLPPAPPTRRTQLAPSSLLLLIGALGWVQLAVFAVVDCEAMAVDASLLRCSLLVSRPHVLARLRGSPRWMLWVAVVLGYALTAICALFFLAAVLHWLRRSFEPAAPPRSALAKPARSPAPRPTDARGDEAVEPPVFAEPLPPSWAGASPASAALSTPAALRMAGASPAVRSPFTPASLPGAGLSPPIVDQPGLERYLLRSSHLPLRRRGPATGANDAHGTPGPLHGSPHSPHTGGSGGALGGATPGSGWGAASPGAWSGLSPDAKYQKAMYVPASGDWQDRAVAHARRVAALLRELSLPEQTLVRWRDNVRLWLSAVVLRPLVALVRDNEAAIREAASRPQPAVAAAGAPALGGGMGSGLFGAPRLGGGGMFGGAAPQPAAAAAASAGGGAPMSPEQWIAANPSHPLVQQLRKLERFWHLGPLAGGSSGAGSGAGAAGAGAAGSHATRYVRRRIFELARGQCLAGYAWDGGGGPAGGGAALGSPAPPSGGRDGAGSSAWDPSLPTDADIVLHVFSAFMDAVLPPPPPGVDGRPAAPAGGGAAGAPAGGAGSLFGARPGGSSLFGGGFGSTLGGGLMSAWGSLGGAQLGGGAQPAPQLPRNAIFAVPAAEMTSFSARHTSGAGARASDRPQSEIVITRMSKAGQPPHFELLVLNTPWPLLPGDANAWDAIALLVLCCEKSGGMLGRVRVDGELHTAFRSAMMPEPARELDLEDSARYRCARRLRAESARGRAPPCQALKTHAQSVARARAAPAAPLRLSTVCPAACAQEPALCAAPVVGRA